MGCRRSCVCFLSQNGARAIEKHASADRLPRPPRPVFSLAANPHRPHLTPAHRPWELSGLLGGRGRRVLRCALFPSASPLKGGELAANTASPPSALCGGGLNRNRRVTGTVVGREPRVGESFFCAERAPLPPTLGRRFHSTRPLTPPHSPALDVEISDAGPTSNFFATDGALTKKIDR